MTLRVEAFVITIIGLFERAGVGKQNQFAITKKCAPTDCGLHGQATLGYTLPNPLFGAVVYDDRTKYQCCHQLGGELYMLVPSSASMKGGGVGRENRLGRRIACSRLCRIDHSKKTTSG